MWQVSWTKAVVRSSLLGACLLASQAVANEPIYQLNQNQNGFDLPGVSLPQGQDEVRAADGTTCSSAVSGTGAYLDVGVIKANRSVDEADLASYGRVVVPLGRKPKRLDCAKLYELEVERLKMELTLLKMGLSADGTTTGSTEDAVAAEPAGVAEATTDSETTASTEAQPPVKKVVKRKKKPAKNWANDGWSDTSNR